MFTYTHTQTHTHSPIHQHITHFSTHTTLCQVASCRCNNLSLKCSAGTTQQKKKLETNQKIVKQLPMQPLPCGRRRLLQSCCCCVPKSTTKNLAHGNNTKKQPCKSSQAEPSRVELCRGEYEPSVLSFTINARPTVARRSRS